MVRTLAAWRRGWLGYLALVGSLLLAAPCAYADPVDELRQVLSIDAGVRNPSEGVQQLRTDNLKAKVAALKTVSELRRALTLGEWRDDPVYKSIVDDKIRRVDIEMRGEVGKRLTNLLTEQARSGDVANRLAVASLIAEMGTSVRALGAGDSKGFARSLMPLVDGLTKDANPAVRQTALRALGNFFGDAKQVAAVFAGVLRNDTAVGPRRIAAEGLGQLVRVVTFLNQEKGSRKPTGVDADTWDILDVLQEVIATSPIGYKDADPRVRAACLEATSLAAQALTDGNLIPDGFPRKDLPPAGRDLTPDEKKLLTKMFDDLSKDKTKLRPVLAAFNDHMRALTPLLNSPDARVQLTSIQALMQVAMARQKLRQLMLSLPNYQDMPYDRATLLAGMDPLESFLQKDLSAVAALGSVEDDAVRKTALVFLLLIEDRALPLAQTITRRLTDKDRSIRWLAARSLGNMPPDKITQSVPALAGLLADQDVSLRVAAAGTLEGMGRHAVPAAAALAQAAARGDAEGRVAALQALRALGEEAAAATVEKLAEVLDQSDADPKVLVAACDTLGAFGPAARKALPALHRLIGHDDPDVRTAVSEAILTINQNQNGKN